MQEWSKPMKKFGIYFPIFFLFIVSSYALDNCKNTLPTEDSPCLLLLPITNPNINCNTINVSIYRNNTYVYYTNLTDYSPSMCSAIFNQIIPATYNLKYSTGDTYQIVVTQGYVRFYVYICLFLIIIFFLVAGYYYEQGIMLYMVGFMSPVMALDIYYNGFPNMTNVFLSNSITIILVGLGMYYLVLPFLIFLGDKLL